MADKITPAEAKRLIDEGGYAYLDVRSVPEFEGGHPQGAYNIPLQHLSEGGMRPNEDFIAQVEATFGKDAKLIVGCKAGGRSQAAVAQLEAAGFQHIKDQFAGYGGARDSMGRLQEAGWAAAGLPVATEAEAGRDHASIAAKARG